MTEETSSTAVQSKEAGKVSRRTRLYVQNGKLLAYTLGYSGLGAVLFALVSLVPMPYVMISLFKLGLVPAIAIISVAGAIRGPIAGFLTGYLGTIIHDLLADGVIAGMTLPAAAWGMVGLVVGLASYDFTRGKSLAKLSIASLAGYGVTLLLLLVIALRIAVYPTLAAIAFVMIPLVTTGIPSVFLLSPIYARVWHMLVRKLSPSSVVT
jgi:energy-coupling factor transport system substrate-specific component